MAIFIIFRGIATISFHFYTDHNIFSSGKLPRNKLNLNHVRRDRIASLCTIRDDSR